VALRIANGQVLLVTPRPRPLQGVRRVKSDSCLPFERATLTVNPRRVSMGLSRLPSRVLIMTVSRLATDPGVDSQRSPCNQILHFGSKSYVVSSKHNRALQPCNLGELLWQAIRVLEPDVAFREPRAFKVRVPGGLLNSSILFTWWSGNPHSCKPCTAVRSACVVFFHAQRSRDAPVV
jgi:hypothetical protein